ncbi:cupin domain-containing protein [Falsiroseomonas sp.]|uniref:cupin domain-containing protein n=1 Tax=Falsiroseomonas sp. TaxID=2870721 RepID=UPI00356344FA
MKTAFQALTIGTAVLAGTAFAASAQTQTTQGQPSHTITTAEEITWRAGPPSIPEGAQSAVLYGNPGAEGLFALRLKLPADYTIRPHTHPKPEIVTVISGTLHFGMGETMNREQARELPAGSFFAMPPGMAHYVFASEDTVIQLNSTGPWTLTYVNPADDPRRQSPQASGGSGDASRTGAGSGAATPSGGGGR